MYYADSCARYTCFLPSCAGGVFCPREGRCNLVESARRRGALPVAPPPPFGFSRALAKRASARPRECVYKHSTISLLVFKCAWRSSSIVVCAQRKVIKGGDWRIAFSLSLSCNQRKMCYIPSTCSLEALSLSLIYICI